MPKKVYGPGTVVDSGSLNDFNNTTYNIVGDGTNPAATKAAARTNLGLGTVAVLNTVPVANGGTGATAAPAARTNLGLGTIATQDSSNVAVTGGTVTGITDLAVADGGTGASTLTGYVKGTGTAPLTGSATVPVADIAGTLPITKGGTGGTTPDTALAALGAGLTSNAQNGYCRLPGGMILQWGVSAAVGNGAVLDVNFPIAFPTAARIVVATPVVNVATTANFNVATFSYTTTKFTLANTSGTSGAVTATFVAIGY